MVIGRASQSTEEQRYDKRQRERQNPAVLKPSG